VRTFGNINSQAGESGESGERTGERKRRTKDEGVQQTSAGFHLQKGGLSRTSAYDVSRNPQGFSNLAMETPNPTVGRHGN